MFPGQEGKQALQVVDLLGPDTSQVFSSDCSRPSLASPPYIVATRVGFLSIPGIELRCFRTSWWPSGVGAPVATAPFLVT